MWRFDELSCLLVCRQERFDLAAEIEVAAAGLLEKRRATLRREVERSRDTDRRLSDTARDPSGAAAIQFSIQPGLGKAPIAPHRANRHVENVRDFLEAETAEEAKLNHSAMARVQRLQRRQRIVQGHQIGALRDAEVRDVRK